ncbi:putative D-3-phosphoglycerate dehydrogenase [Burkholderia multivorans]
MGRPHTRIRAYGPAVARRLARELQVRVAAGERQLQGARRVHAPARARRGAQERRRDLRIRGQPRGGGCVCGNAARQQCEGRDVPHREPDTHRAMQTIWRGSRAGGERGAGLRPRAAHRGGGRPLLHPSVQRLSHDSRHRDARLRMGDAGAGPRRRDRADRRRRPRGRRVDRAAPRKSARARVRRRAGRRRRDAPQLRREPHGHDDGDAHDRRFADGAAYRGIQLSALPPARRPDRHGLRRRVARRDALSVLALEAGGRAGLRGGDRRTARPVARDTAGPAGRRAAVRHEHRPGDARHAPHARAHAALTETLGLSPVRVE